MNKDNINLGLKVIRELRKLNNSDINIKEVKIIVNGDTFEVKKKPSCKYEYDVKVNGKSVKCAEDNTLCRNNGICYDCGYCL